MLKPIVVVGSINLDVAASADHIPRPGETVVGSSFNTFSGGKGANQAVAVAKLGYPVSMVGNVGSDVFGGQLSRGLTNSGVDSKYVNCIEGASGVALITTTRGGENSIVVVPGANARLGPESLERAVPILEQAGLFLAQLEIPLETVEYLARFAERHKIPLMLDPAPARELSGTLLQRVSWITPNETETHELVKGDIEYDQNSFEAADCLLARGVHNVLLKLGRRGCVIASRNRTKEHVPAFSVEAVDTTAAGDAFNAGFGVGLMRGYPLRDSAIFASAVAAISVTRAGAQPSMPSAQEVQRFLEQRGEDIRETESVARSGE